MISKVLESDILKAQLDLFNQFRSFPFWWKRSILRGGLQSSPGLNWDNYVRTY